MDHLYLGWARSKSISSAVVRRVRVAPPVQCRPEENPYEDDDSSLSVEPQRSQSAGYMFIVTEDPQCHGTSRDPRLLCVVH